jgi:hypothetical protein
MKPVFDQRQAFLPVAQQPRKAGSSVNQPVRGLEFGMDLAGGD